jgi:hypothetical protein
MLIILLIATVSAVASNIVDEAKFYLSFEGEDNNSLESPCWANRGVTGQYATPSRPVPPLPADAPTVTQYGLKGQAYDSTMLTPETANMAYMWGEYGSNVPVEDTLIDVNSVTVTAWFKIPEDEIYGHCRLFSNDSIEVHYAMVNPGQANEVGFLRTRINTSNFKDSIYDSSHAGFYTARGRWVFIAITYDALAPNEQLKYYFADEENAVQFDVAVEMNQGHLTNDRYGGNIWFANLRQHGSGARPVVGYIDEFRIFSSMDSAGALSISEIESIRQHDLKNRFLDYSDVVETANVHFSFDGELRDEDVVGSPAWENSGITGPGERASRVGGQVSPLTRANAIALYGVIPEVTPNGLKGQAYDGTGFTPGTASNTLNWGEFSFDTAIEEAIKDVWSFTVTGWIKMDEYVHQGRLLVTPSFGLNFIQNETTQQIHGLIAGSGWTVRSSASDLYNAVDKWVFFALTYDGTKAENNVHYFVGSPTNEVIPDRGITSDWGQLTSVGYGGNIYLGNVQPSNGNRPFVGYLDEIRIWSTQNQSSAGALNYDQIEAVRKFDLGITKCDGGFLAGDVNHDCFVDITDLGILMNEWLKCNDLTEPSCGN